MVYPEVVTLLGSGVVGNIFAAIFFLMLITLALGCIFAAFETIISAICDEVPVIDCLVKVRLVVHRITSCFQR